MSIELTAKILMSIEGQHVFVDVTANNASVPERSANAQPQVLYQAPSTIAEQLARLSVSELASTRAELVKVGSLHSDQGSIGNVFCAKGGSFSDT